MNSILKKLYDHKYSFIFINALIIIFYFLYFFVILQSSLMGDDILNANAGGSNYLPGDSVWKLTVRQWFVWFDRGRFFPFSNYVYLLFAAMPNVVCYKLFLLVLVYLNSLLMSKCMEKLLNSKAAGLLTMIIFPLSLQLAPAYDTPLYCYHGLMQFVLLGSEISVLCVFKYLDLEESENKKSHLWILIAGAAAYMISLGMYEVAFVMASFIGLCTWCKTGSVKKSLKVLIPDIAVFVLMLIINIIFKHNATDTYSGTSVNLELSSVIVTFRKQFISTFPFSTLIEDLKHGATLDLTPWLSRFRFRDIIMILCFLLIFAVLMFKLKDKKFAVRELIFIFFAGLCLMVFPSVLISITEKYQAELEWGSGYLLNYLQNFGLAMILLSIFLLIIRNAGSKARIAVFAIIAVISVPMLLGQQAESRIAVENRYLSTGYCRDTSVAAIRSGVLDDVTDDDVLFGTSGCTFDYAESKQFYTFAAKRYINAKESSLFISELAAEYGVKSEYNLTDGFYAATTYADDAGGYTMVGKCVYVKSNSSNDWFEKIQVTNPKMYVTGEIPYDYSSWKLVKSCKSGNLYEYSGTLEFPLN